MPSNTGSTGRVAVTGATGFIGRGLVTRLTSEPELEPVRIVRAMHDQPFEHSAKTRISGTIDAHTDWSQALTGVDAVVHAAARVHVLREQATDPFAAFRATNLDGTLNLARQAVDAGVRRFVFLSSIGVNGAETHAEPFRETDCPAPETPYAQSKYEAEQGLRELGATSEMEIVIARPPLVYGPGGRDGVPGNFGKLVRLVETGIPLPLASIANRRSFIARENLVDFLITCLRHPKAPGETLCVSDGADQSTPDLIRAIASGLQKPARLLPCPPALLQKVLALGGRGSTARQLCGSLQIDNTKARTLLDWVPPAKFHDAIRAAVARHETVTQG